MDLLSGQGRRRLCLASGALALLGLLAILLASSGARAANDPPPSGGTVNGDWTVQDTRGYAACSITLAGNLTVSGSGKLTLDSVLLVMNPTFAGQYGIEVQSGGRLVIRNGSNLTSAAGGEYRFVVREGGNLTVSDSELRRCGYSWGVAGEAAGVCLLSDSCRFDRSLLASCHFAVVARGASPVFADCRFSGNSQGCVVMDSSASFSGCVFEYNQNGANFENWSGTLSGCTFAFNTGFGLLAYGSRGNLSRCDLVGNRAGNCVLVGSDLAASNCTLRDSLYGLYIDEGGPEISDCTVTGNRYGVYIYEGAPSLVRCTVSKSSLFGLSCLFGGPSLESCSIYETGYSPRDGIYWGRGLNLFSSNLTFSKGRLKDNYFGIEARYSTLSVSGVLFEANSVGIYALESGTYLAGCNFTKNLQIGAHLTDFCTGAFEGCAFTCETQGAAFDHRTSTQMRNTTFRQCREGLRLYDCDAGAAVLGCAFENNSIGASLMGSASRVLSCSFAFNVNYSLSCSGGSAEVRNCSFRDCPTNALTLAGCGGVVDGNRFDSVAAAGILCQNSTSEISNNTFQNGTGTAIRSIGTAAAPDIHDNLFSKNGLGVALSDGSLGRVHHNNFSSNQQAGMLIRESGGEVFCNTVSGSIHGISCILLSDPSIHGNDVFGNEGGILCEDSSNATVFSNLVHGNSRFGILARMSYPALEGNSVWDNLDGIVVVGCRGPAAVTLTEDRVFSNTIGLSGQGSVLELEGCNFTLNLMAGARLVDCISSVRHGSFTRNRDGLRPEGGRIVVEQCDFLQNNSTGILTESADAVVDGCYFFQNTDGALDQGNSTIRFEDGVFESNLATGFYCQWSTTASWTVGRTASASNDWFALRGNLTVRRGGSLGLGNSTLHMMLASPGEFAIEVQDGGRLEMVRGTMVEAAAPDNKYSFRLLPGGNLTIEEGTLQDCGGGGGVAGERPGLVLQSPACVLREVRFQNCSFGLVADGIEGDFEYLAFERCDYAVLAISSSLRLDNSSVNGSTTMDLQLQKGAALILVNTTFDRDRVSLMDRDCHLEVYWYLGISVEWQNRVLIEGAELRLKDSIGTHLFGGYTDERGWLPWVPVLELWQSSSRTVIRNPYTITVSKANITYEETITFQKSVVRDITLYDLIGPDLLVDFPLPGAMLNRSLVEFGGLAADSGTGLDAVEWSSDGQGWQPANGSGEWSFLASLADGTRTVLVRATDAAGNRAVVGINLTVKTRINAPELSGPAEGLLTRLPEVSVNGTTENGSRVLLNGQEVSVLSGRFSATVRLTEGNNTITVTASDEAGNTATIARTVVLDTTPPALLLGSPRDGSYTNVRETTVSGRTEPGARVTVDGKALINSGGSFALVVDLPSDANTLNITVIDLAGNANSTQVTVLVDTEPPPLDIISPRAGHRTASRGITVRGTTEPFSNVTARDWSTTAGEDGSFSLNVTLLYGNNTIMIRSTDRAGNLNAVAWHVVRDRPPEGPGSPWIPALAAFAVVMAAENAAILLLWRRRKGAAFAATASSPIEGPAKETVALAAAEPAAPEAATEPAVPVGATEPAPPEALPVEDDEPVETVDMR